jgi:hypothetical protein
MRVRRDRGVSTVEWGAMILVVAAVVGVLVISNLPAEIASVTKSAICEVAQDSGCRDGGGNGGGDEGEGRPEAGTPGNPTGAPTGAPTAGPTAGAASEESEYQEARREADAANSEAESAETDFGNIKNELLDLLKGLVGIDDIQKCITEGDIGACLWALAGALPLGKALKFVKMIPKLAKFLLRTKKIWDRLNQARKRRKAAADRLRKAEDACRLANSFVPGTMVVLADGSRKAIEDVGVGDRVWAADPSLGRVGSWPVTALISGSGRKRLVDVTVDLDGVWGGSTATITATDGHPFWVPDERRWIDAGDLYLGDGLLTSAGDRAMVVGTRAYTGAARVHNLTVAGLHTYHVGAGATGILVHNCPKKLTSSIDKDPLLKKAAQNAGKSVQKEIDHLTSELAKGNLNPGIGTKALKGTGLSYARGRDGARVFFRETEDGIEIVGKADKNNEDKVIKRLQELYG